LSWLQTTVGDSNEPVLQAQIEYLQIELNRANDQLDNNFSRLEAAGLGGVALAEKLAAAEERIAELEDEIRALIQRNKASLALVSAQKREAQ
jgi:chromosome segregation ATPase